MWSFTWGTPEPQSNFNFSASKLQETRFNIINIFFFCLQDEKIAQSLNNFPALPKSDYRSEGPLQLTFPLKYQGNISTNYSSGPSSTKSVIIPEDPSFDPRGGMIHSSDGILHKNRYYCLTRTGTKIPWSSSWSPRHKMYCRLQMGCGIFSHPFSPSYLF